MKKFKVIFGMVICLSLLLSGNLVNACWRGFSSDELIEEADIIVIGELIGEKLVVENPKASGMYMTQYTIDVAYVGKGSALDTITVVTNGIPFELIDEYQEAVMTSIDYQITELASGHMLLFLSESEVGLMPLSPQAIIDLDKEHNGEILNQYTSNKSEFVNDYNALVNKLMALEFEKRDVTGLHIDNFFGGMVEVNELEEIQQNSKDMFEKIKDISNVLENASEQDESEKIINAINALSGDKNKVEDERNQASNTSNKDTFDEDSSKENASNENFGELTLDISRDVVRNSLLILAGVCTLGMIVLLKNKG